MLGGLLSKFTDPTGREWLCEITIATVKVLRRDLGIDLREALKPHSEAFAKVMGDPEKFGQLMWVILEKQAEKAGVAPEQFGELFDGETVRAAGLAVWEAIWSFFQGPKTAAKATTAFRAGMDELETKMGEAMDQVPSQLRSYLNRTSAGSNAAASLELIHSPGA